MVTKLPVVQPLPPEEPAPVQSPLHFAASLAPRRVYIDTFGCQMNMHDSQRMVSLMASEGYVPTETPDDADLIILNSCSVREKAEQKVRTRAGQMKKVKRANPDVVLAIGGCVATQEGSKLLERIPHADIVFGPDHIGRLPEMVRSVQAEHGRFDETRLLGRKAGFDFPKLGDGPVEVSAFVSVMKGCDKFCTYCVVPYTRGREVSRAASEILDEVRVLAERGTKEVVLLGQTVNSYGNRPDDGQIPFAELLYRVAEIDGIERIRFTSPHPSSFSDAQIRAFSEIPKLCPHMHLPVQSGSTSILQAMRRDYTREEYLAIIHRLREVAPQVALTTDVIVGFPGETEADFLDTMSLMEEVRYQGAFSFAFSERTGTKAVEFPDPVPVPERFERLRILQARQDEITQEWLQSMVGERQTVLVEGPSKTDPTRSTGRNGQNRPVHVDGIYAPGTLLEVDVVEAYKHSLLARLA
ncbi:MAG: tRNA (N6-isopentenyl adenosine(37)-C2)-methylthiotransferase MiaB [Myxococcales bacterium]|nr:tRNA (N6-isopentenyl adenosine(37)-C2)-methylthiotransferase MiaB [Myxococcales bacterium]